MSLPFGLVVADLQDRVSSLLEQFELYYQKAREIDDKVKVNDPRPVVPLDDLPYGEEEARIRSEGVFERLRELDHRLEFRLEVELTKAVESDEVLQEIEDEIDDLQRLFDDLTPMR